MRFPCRVVSAPERLRLRGPVPAVTHGGRGTRGTGGKGEARALGVRLSRRQESDAVPGFQGRFPHTV